MAIVINGSGTVTGITGITGTNATVTGITSVASNSASTPVVLQDSGSNTNTCRAWVNFNGTGTVAIRGSFNVSSITDNGTGDYTVNFTNSMPDTSYAVTFGAMRDSSVTGVVAGAYVTLFGSATYTDAFSTGSVRVVSKLDNASTTDNLAVILSVFR